jgi:uncharacterized membrane protein
MFEFLFKYPSTLFHKGQFVLLSPWPIWAMLLAIAVAAGALYWHVTRHHGALNGIRPLAIWVLETGMVALILFLLWHPALSVATLRPQQNVVAVLVDNSKSMGLSDAGGTREAAAKSVLNGGLIRDLSEKFQVRMYEFGREPERITGLDQLNAKQPATRIGDTMERILAESSSLPLGAIVVLSDGADNSGGIDLETIAAIRRQRIPVHTVGFGREHPAKDVEVEEVTLPVRALPKSRLTAQVTMQSWGLSGSKGKLVVRESGKVLASQDISLKNDGILQTESVVFNVGDKGPKTLEIGIEPISGEDNAYNNKVTRLVTVEDRKPRILYIEGEPRWDYKFLRRALDDFQDVEIASILRTTQNKLYRQGTSEHELEDGFPTKASDLFAYQGLIIGTVEANYFTAGQQQLIRDFVDRRGGGLLFLGGRVSLSDGGYPHTPLEDLVPVRLLDQRGTFHRDFSGVELTTEGANSMICRLDDDPVKNAQRWKQMPQVASYQEVGERKPGASELLDVVAPSKRKSPLLVTENFGRGRTAVIASGGLWRWQMWLPHENRTLATFWQQMFRYLVTDTPGQVSATTPKAVLADDTRVPVRVDVRDKEYKPVTNAKVQARFLSPDGTSATLELTPQPLEEGIYTGEWTAEKPGSYVAEIIAGHDTEEVGHDVLTFRREDGVAENFHTSQNKELLQKLSQQTGGRYYTPEEASKLGNDISYSEAGISSRETKDLWDMPIVFLLALGIRATEWLLRRKWGVV